MNKFKSFFTFFAFLWLCLCGFWGFYALWQSGNFAWTGLIINALALPLWTFLRYLRPQKFVGDIRESPAFACVLLGLGIALLTDAQKGLPVYLAIYNLFVVLLYLYHLSSVRHPSLPAVETRFPALSLADSSEWDPEHCCGTGEKGTLVVFLRGSFCADSRRLLRELQDVLPDLSARGVTLSVFTTEPLSAWAEELHRTVPMSQLDGQAETNAPFVAPGAAPLLFWPRVQNALRPSAWLLDGEGYILWRYLPGNYRVPGSGAKFFDQLYRLED